MEAKVTAWINTISSALYINTKVLNYINVKTDLIERLTGVKKCAVDFAAIINKVFNRFGKGEKGMM